MKDIYLKLLESHVAAGRTMKQLQSLYSMFTFERLRVKPLSDIEGWFVLSDRTRQAKNKPNTETTTGESA